MHHLASANRPDELSLGRDIRCAAHVPLVFFGVWFFVLMLSVAAMLHTSVAYASDLPGVPEVITVGGNAGEEDIEVGVEPGDKFSTEDSVSPDGFLDEECAETGEAVCEESDLICSDQDDSLQEGCTSDLVGVVEDARDKGAEDNDVAEGPSMVSDDRTDGDVVEDGAYIVESALGTTLDIDNASQADGANVQVYGGTLC